MKPACTLFLTLLALIFGASAQAAEPAAVSLPPAAALPGQLAGHTLSAVAFIPPRPGTPWRGQLTRLMLQAYLGADGRAVVRVWDPARGAYTPPAERRWSLTGSTLCLEVPAPGNGPMCANVHVWGPRIAGVGTKPSYAMIDGDLKPGNVILGRR
jgi:hypothetical protein